jgi:hypothetical protein
MADSKIDSPFIIGNNSPRAFILRLLAAYQMMAALARNEIHISFLN